MDDELYQWSILELANVEMRIQVTETTFRHDKCRFRDEGS